MVNEMDPRAFQARREENPAVVLLDVREDQELAIASVEGAVHIPMNDVPSRVAELDATAEIVVMCHHGMRSNQVAHFLDAQGFENVTNLTGGIDAWSLLIDPSIPRY